MVKFAFWAFIWEEFLDIAEDFGAQDLVNM